MGERLFQKSIRDSQAPRLELNFSEKKDLSLHFTVEIEILLR